MLNTDPAAVQAFGHCPGGAAAYVFRPVPEASQAMEAMLVDVNQAKSEDGMDDLETDQPEEETMDGNEMMSSGGAVF